MSEKILADVLRETGDDGVFLFGRNRNDSHDGVVNGHRVRLGKQPLAIDDLVDFAQCLLIFDFGEFPVEGIEEL